MILTYLNVPDHRHDQEHRDYAPQLARDLTVAYAGHRQMEYDDLTLLLLPWLTRRKTPMQHMRLLFMLGLGALRSGSHALTLQYVADAMTVARYIEDPGAFVVLAKLAASACYDMQLFGQAYRYTVQTLSALGALSPDDVDARVRYQVYERLAIDSFLLARYDESLVFLQQAHTLIGQHSWDRERARWHWIDAQVLRWRREFKRAFQAIELVQEYYETSPDLMERGRFHGVHAEITLDCAELAMQTTDRPQLLKIAERHCHAALDDTRLSQDLAGEGLAFLAQARLSRSIPQIMGDHEYIDRAAAIAERLHDIPLLAQVWTARGDSMRWHGNFSAAQQCYQETLTILKHSDAQAYRQKSERILLLGQEMEVG
ncbi:MAG: hypothetical protein H0X24_02740 [Ktedonobacterales bacterium]|nr:hypothetical protein [Ktedonobacterales bacterium]